MNFEWVMITYPDGRVTKLPPAEFLAIPLGERIELLTGRRMQFFRNGQPVSPLEAMKKT